MRTTTRRIGLILALAVLWAVPVAASDAPWCDLANCAMCKHLTADPALLQNMTWEHYDLSNGMLSVCSVPPAHLKAYAAATQGMEDTKAKLAAGEQLTLCNMCKAFGRLLQEGMKTESVRTKFGHVQICSSDNAETLARMHAWAERTRTEMAKMAQAVQPSRSN